MAERADDRKSCRKSPFSIMPTVMKEKGRQQRRYWRELRKPRKRRGQESESSENLGMVIVNLGDDPYGRLENQY
jgi:hypothetical protein